LVTTINRMSDNDVEIVLGLLDEEIRHMRDDQDTLDRGEIMYFQALVSLKDLFEHQRSIAQMYGTQVMLTTVRETTP
jgi:hypothetical protein